MRFIDHLPEDEKKHFVLCTCGLYIDCRNLQQVFDHEHWMQEKPELTWKYAIKKGEPIAYTKTRIRMDVN